jgi:hypothetical protein
VSFDKHDETRLSSLIWVSYFKCVSRTTPKSLAVKIVCNLLLTKLSVIPSENTFSSCGVPSNNNFVLAGFRRSEFAQHHLATLFKSSSKTLPIYLGSKKIMKFYCHRHMNPAKILFEDSCGTPYVMFKASFHSGNLSVDWNGQESFSLSCELWVGTNDFNTKKNFLVRSNPRIIFLSGN